MIMRKRAELDTQKPPGQVINRDQTIGGIIDRIMKDESPRDGEPKKLTFEEWWEEAKKKFTDWDDAELVMYQFVWKAAQENK